MWRHTGTCSDNNLSESKLLVKLKIAIPFDLWYIRTWPETTPPSTFLANQFVEVIPMTGKRSALGIYAVVAFAAISCLAASPITWNESLLVTLGGKNGAVPESRPVYTASGEILGTAAIGGNTASPCLNPNGCGVVFKLSRADSNGNRDYRVIYTFNGGANDGQGPLGNLVLDSAGNLYGVTEFGGSLTGEYGGGTVYKLSPSASGEWSETVLHSFVGSGDGFQPLSGLTADQAGNLYGTTSVGGANGEGTVYELSPNENGSWSETLLYSFGARDSSTGSVPAGEVTLDAAGNIYGTASSGGSLGYGVVFELSPNSGSWAETVLYSFTGNRDQGYPATQLWLDAGGNIYGTSGPVRNGNGAVYELTPTSGGSWTETTLHKFEMCPTCSDGLVPSSGLTPDERGNLYGTTLFSNTGGGTIYRFVPNAGGGWNYHQIYNFNGNPQSEPDGGVTFGNRHVAYGVMIDDTVPSSGGVYQITAGDASLE